jgi:hypothetical protein
MKTRTLAAIAAVALAACGADPVGVNSSSNPEIKVERLFDHEGCTMYRFHDFGSARYYVRCNASPSNVEWDERRYCGKTTCTVPFSVMTVNQ